MTTMVFSKCMCETARGVVLFLDALGIKRIWEREDPVEVIRRWHSVCDDLGSARSLLQGGASEFRLDWSIQAFSDTVIVSCVPRPPRSSDRDLLLDASQLAMRFVAGGLLNKIKFRGAVSFGSIYRGSNILIGPAVDEAAAEYESTNWIGVHLTRSAVTTVLESAPMDQVKFSVWTQCFIPFREGKGRPGMAAGWPLVLDMPYWTDSAPFGPKARTRFLRLLSDMKTGQGDVAEKYRNTVSFYDQYASYYQSPDVQKATP